MSGSRRAGLGLAGVVALVIALPVPSAPAATTPCPNADAVPGTVSNQALADAVLCLLNVERVKRGAQAMGADADLALPAQSHADDMVARKYFAHRSPQGGVPITRVRATKFDDGWRFIDVKEHIAFADHARATPRQIVLGGILEPASLLTDPLYGRAAVGVSTGAPNNTSPLPSTTYVILIGFRDGGRPVPGKAFVAKVLKGRVFVTPPRGARAAAAPSGRRQLLGNEILPVGSTLDTTLGRIQITSASDLRGTIQTADVSAGAFTVVQRRARSMITVMRLAGGSFRGCPRASAASAKAKRKRRRVRRLFASGSGSFRTDGRYASAIVRGTKWLTEDRCDGTVVRVSEGVVGVRDKRRRKTRLVRAGRSFLVRAF